MAIMVVYCCFEGKIPLTHHFIKDTVEISYWLRLVWMT